MGTDERESMQRELRETERNLAREQNSFQDELNYRRNEEVASLSSLLLDELREYAGREQLELILTDAAYASTALDIAESFLESPRAGPEAR